MLKLAYIFCLVLISCSLISIPAVAQSSTLCLEYGRLAQVGLITHLMLDEVSGIIASRLNPGVWWVHNDSGDGPKIYAVLTLGQLLAVYTVDGAENRDWEDISAGPGATGNPAIYIGDIGNNGLSRQQIVVYRIDEPNFNPLEALIFPIRAVTPRAEAFPARYPDGPHDAEGMFVDPSSGQIYLVAKGTGERSVIYRYPMPLVVGEEVVLERVTEVRPGLATAADITSDGLRVIIRDDHEAYEYCRTPEEPLEAMFDREGLSVPLFFWEEDELYMEEQGEAIAYTYPDNLAIVTTSEILPAPINMCLCIRFRP